jgi:hypothetical protein
MLINLQFSIKQYEGKLLSQQSSFAFNVSTFLKNNLSVNDLYTYDLNYVQDIHYQKIKTLQRISFDTLPNGYFINDDYAEYLPFSMNHSLDTTFKSHHRLMIEGTFMCMNDIYDIYGFSKIVLSVNRKGKEIIWRAVVINNKLGKSQQPSPNHLILNSNTHTWDKVQVFTQANEILPGDVLKVYVWNSGKQKLAIKNLTLSEVD